MLKAVQNQSRLVFPLLRHKESMHEDIGVIFIKHMFLGIKQLTISTTGKGRRNIDYLAYCTKYTLLNTEIILKFSTCN